MNKKHIEKILEDVISGLGKWNSTREAEIVHIIDKKDFILVTIKLMKKKDRSVVYGSGSIYAIDKNNKMYYFIHPMDSLDEIIQVVRRGRRNYIYRMKEKALNFYRNKIAPRSA